MCGMQEEFITADGRRQARIRGKTWMLPHRHPGGDPWAGIWFPVGVDRAINSRKFSVFVKLVLELKGDTGGETVHVNIEDREGSGDGTSTKVPLLLTDQWKTYMINLADFKTADLVILTVPFGLVFYEEPVAFSVRSVKYVKPD